MTGSAEGKRRKPYVVSKQRQNWSDEEHELFVEAVKLWVQFPPHACALEIIQNQVNSGCMYHFIIVLIADK